MTLLKKALYGIAFVATGLASAATFAQAEQANEKAAEAAAGSGARVESDARAIKDGDSIVTNKTTVTKEAGAAARVETPNAQAPVERPNRGVAAEGRPARPNPVQSANSLTGNGK